MAIELKRELTYDVEVSYISKDKDSNGGEEITKNRQEKTLEDATAFIKKHRDDVESDDLKSWFTAKLEIKQADNFIMPIIPDLDQAF